MEIKLKRSYLKVGDIKVKSFELKQKGPIKFCNYKGVEYLIFGDSKNMNQNDYKVLSNVFGNEVVYIDSKILIPRNFFFI